MKEIYFVFLNKNIVGAAGSHRLDKTFLDVNVAGSADSLDIPWTLVTGGARGDLTDLFLPKGLMPTFVTNPPILRQTQLLELLDP